MANTFGGEVIIDADYVRAAIREADADPTDFVSLDRANSFSNPTGFYPARGWVILTRDGLLRLDRFASQNMVIADGEESTLTFNKLYVVNSRCMWRGVPGDDGQTYLVEFTDARGLYKNGLYEFPTDASYNVRAPGYDGSYYADSLNSGSPWTWQTMITNLWSELPLLGSNSTIPAAYTPTGTPENWSFPGCSAWEALCGVLDHLGLAVSFDPTLSTNQYSIVLLGGTAAETTALTNLQEDLEDYLEQDEVPFSKAAGAVPAFVTVYFHRRNQYYGTEETVRKDADQWGTDTDYQVRQATGFSGVGEHFLWDDFTVRFDENSTPLSADTTTATTIATARIADYVRKVTRDGNLEMRQRYAGVKAFGTSGACDAVCWFRPPGKDWCTEIYRDMWGLWEVDARGGLRHDVRGEDSSNNQQPMFGPAFPNYPVHAQMVRTTGTATGTMGGTLWTGFTQQFLAGTGYRDREACYAFDKNGGTTAGTFPARLISEQAGLPLYGIAPGVAGPPGGSLTTDYHYDAGPLPTTSGSSFSGSAGTLFVDANSGFYATLSGGGGTFELRMVPANIVASVFYRGIVTETLQQWLGEKQICGSAATPLTNNIDINPLPYSATVGGNGTGLTVNQDGVSKVQMTGGTTSFGQLSITVWSNSSAQSFAGAGDPGNFTAPNYVTSPGFFINFSSAALVVSMYSPAAFVEVFDIGVPGNAFGGFYSCRGNRGVDAGPIIIKDVSGVTYTLTTVGGIVVKLG